MAEINAEREKMVEENGRRMRGFTLVAIFFSDEFGYMRTAAETDVRGKHMSCPPDWLHSHDVCRSGAS